MKKVEKLRCYRCLKENTARCHKELYDSCTLKVAGRDEEMVVRCKNHEDISGEIPTARNSKQYII